MYYHSKFRDYKRYHSPRSVNKNRMDNIRLGIVCVFVMTMIFTVMAIEQKRDEVMMLTAEQYIETCEAPAIIYSSIDQ